MILDTSFLIDLIRGKERALEKYHEIEEENREVSIPAPTLYELWAGIKRSKVEREEEMLEIIGSQQVADLESDAGKEAGKIQSSMAEKGQKIGHVDALITGIAVSSGEILLTRDQDFETVENLRVEKY